MLVFLLTKSGVREIAFDLDFLTGKVEGERRRTFRYDELASARVSEDGARRRTDPKLQAIADRVVRSRTFRLLLLSGETIEISAKGYGDQADGTPVNESEQLRMRLVSSGIAGALSLLETVTAEGGSPRTGTAPPPGQLVADAVATERSTSGCYGPGVRVVMASLSGIITQRVG